MSELSDQLASLKAQLDALSKVRTQDDFDEGARLHNIHNAPWKKGQYSHLEFPPYQFRAFPKAVYNKDFEAARLEYDQAHMLPARGSDDAVRATAILQAQRKMALACRKVESQTEQDALGAGWYDSPEAAVLAEKAFQDEMATVAAHRAYEDRNMGELAKAEIDAADEAAEDFLAVVPERKKPGPRVKVPA